MNNGYNIEEIRQKANIIDVITSYDIPLTLKGKNYFGICPFHEDHSPSMSVSPSKQIYKCFSCGAAGNVFTFVKNYENVSFLEAVKIVADKCGLAFNIKLKRETNNQNKLEYEIMDLALKFYHNNIYTKEATKAKEYLLNRDLREEDIKTFELGYAPLNGQALTKLMLSKGYREEVLDNLGLIKNNDFNPSDLFIDRVMFPIHDLEGRVVGFTARALNDTKIAKYLNSKENVIFKKGDILFNYHRALKEIKRQKTIIIVEGNMDAIRLYINDFKNVVALMGTALTDKQMEIIKSNRSKVILMLDNDEAGENATLSVGEALEKNNIETLVVRLSNEKDPDSYIVKEGVEAMQNALANPLSFLDFKLNYYKKNKDLNKASDLVSYVKEIIGNLKNVEDNLTKEITIKKLSEEYDIDINILKKELAVQNSPPKKEKEVKVVKNKLSKYELAASNILYYMMNDLKFVYKFQKELGYFQIKEYRSLANEIIYFGEKNKEINMADFMSFIATKDYIYDFVLEIINRVNVEDLQMNDFTNYLKICQEEMQKQKIAQLKKEIEEELDPNKEMELAQKLIEIKKGCVKNE